jgi:hypothetical protein
MLACLVLGLLAHRGRRRRALAELDDGTRVARHRRARGPRSDGNLPGVLRRHERGVRAWRAVGCRGARAARAMGNLALGADALGTVGFVAALRALQR